MRIKSSSGLAPQQLLRRRGPGLVPRGQPGASVQHRRVARPRGRRRRASVPVQRRRVPGPRGRRRGASVPVQRRRVAGPRGRRRRASVPVQRRRVPGPRGRVPPKCDLRGPNSAARVRFFFFSRRCDCSTRTDLINTPKFHWSDKFIHQIMCRQSEVLQILTYRG